MWLFFQNLSNETRIKHIYTLYEMLTHPHQKACMRIFIADSLVIVKNETTQISNSKINKPCRTSTAEYSNEREWTSGQEIHRCVAGTKRWAKEVSKQRKIPYVTSSKTGKLSNSIKS